MTRWRALSDTEVVELATRLQALDRTWELGATPSARRAPGFTRRALVIRPRWDALDTVLEREDGEGARRRREREEETVERVRLRLTDHAHRWDQTLDAFARMSTALRDVLGEPTDRSPGRYAAIHWVGTDTTLLLERSESSVYLELVTNKRLALDEELQRLDEMDDEEQP
ncbi:DUF6301 family protein [Streptomyces roseolus]|uniref:DUF6301 family protein n=1 Tax=Streptomyces roseolus TaxID=67358 RepID=UPI0016763341|nr:DUF6301 family protein [Streptomyces roseolus]